MSQANLEKHIRDIEIENSNLASLYVALSQLHSSLDVNEVLGVIVEILLNFVGGETFAVMVMDGRGTLRAIAAHGVSRHEVPSIPRDADIVAKALVTGEPQMLAFENERRPDPLNGPPIVQIPLHAAGEVIGLLPVWTFLQQKQGLTDIDHEIIQLLSKSAGTALEAARLAMTARDESRLPGYYEAFAPLLG
jgi:nitrate/nitrite-specific signal transduction histidine kinase